MTDKAKLIFIVLTVCGTLCILASLGAVCVLYQQNAATMAVPTPGGTVPKEVLFFAFVGMPSLITFVAGIGMVVIGVKVGQKNDLP